MGWLQFSDAYRTASSTTGWSHCNIWMGPYIYIYIILSTTVSHEWAGGLGQGGWCYVCVVSLDSLCWWQVQVSVYCARRIPAPSVQSYCNLINHFYEEHYQPSSGSAWPACQKIVIGPLILGTGGDRQICAGFAIPLWQLHCVYTVSFVGANALIIEMVDTAWGTGCQTSSGEGTVWRIYDVPSMALTSTTSITRLQVTQNLHCCCIP